MKKQIDPALLVADNYPHHCTQDTQFGDLDALGHVNNLAVARFYESARARWQLDIIFKENIYRTDHPTKIVLVEAFTRYMDEIHFPETLQLTTGIGNIGNSSYVCHQALFRDNRCIGYCEATLVHVINGKAQALPDHVRSRMQQLIVKNKEN